MLRGDEGDVPRLVSLKEEMVSSLRVARSSLKMVPPLLGPPPDVVPNSAPSFRVSAPRGFAPFANLKAVSAVVDVKSERSTLKTVPQPSTPPFSAVPYKYLPSETRLATGSAPSSRLRRLTMAN